jgi:hypothetical protein
MSKDEQQRTILLPSAFVLCRRRVRFVVDGIEALIWTRTHGDDSDTEAALPPVSCRTLCCDGAIVHHSSLR